MSESPRESSESPAPEPESATPAGEPGPAAGEVVAKPESERPLELILAVAIVLLLGLGWGGSLVYEQQRLAALPVATIETSMGTIRARLFAERAPLTVSNFIKLADERFYEGIIFHRVIPGFMVQVGDPLGDGSGGPGYTFRDEFARGLRHDRAGRLSMANSGPNTNGSQFFITVAPTAHLDNKHSIFGQVIEGMEVVEKIVQLPRDGRDKPINPPTIVKVHVDRVPDNLPPPPGR